MADVNLQLREYGRVKGVASIADSMGIGIQEPEVRAPSNWQ